MGPSIDYLSSFSPNMIYLMIGATVLLLLLVVVIMIWSKVGGGREAGSAPVGMQFTDVEKMRREGMISEDEYKVIKRKMAERTLADSRRTTAERQDLTILQEAAIDPEAVRKLLPAGKREPAPVAGPDGDVVDPLKGPAKPAMNMPRVVREKNSATAENKPGELDLLLQKGAITPEQYQKLKSHFRSPE